MHKFCTGAICALAGAPENTITLLGLPSEKSPTFKVMSTKPLTLSLATRRTDAAASALMGHACANRTSTRAVSGVSGKIRQQELMASSTDLRDAKRRAPETTGGSTQHGRSELPQTPIAMSMLIIAHTIAAYLSQRPAPAATTTNALILVILILVSRPASPMAPATHKDNCRSLTARGAVCPRAQIAVPGRAEHDVMRHGHDD